MKVSKRLEPHRHHSAARSRAGGNRIAPRGKAAGLSRGRRAHDGAALAAGTSILRSDLPRSGKFGLRHRRARHQWRRRAWLRVLSKRSPKFTRYRFPVGIFVQFSNMIFQGVPERFPKLRLAFLEIGCTWLPYWLDRMDEHWEKRGKIETPLLTQRPSDCVRQRPIFFSFESEEKLLPETFPLRRGRIISSMPPTFRTGTASFPRTCSTRRSAKICQTEPRTRFFTKT